MELTEPISIHRQVFKERWMSLQHTTIPVIYTARVEQLKNTYPCFKGKTGAGSQNGRCGGKKAPHADIHHVDYPTARSMRPRIGMLFTNREEKTRKNFVAFMNKLSPHNRNEILPNFVKSLIPDNIDIYVDQLIRLFQVQPTYHDLYMEVLYCVIAISPDRARVLIAEHFQSFVEKGHMVPSDILGSMEHIDTNSESMDELCEYTKWKKQTKSLIVLYVHLLSQGVFGHKKAIEELLLLLGKICNEYWESPYILDVYLDITLCCVESVHKYMPRGLSAFPAVVHHYKEWDRLKDGLKPASRFKIMDILAIIPKK